MKANLATMENLHQVENIVKTSISKIFPKYFVKEAVDFFINFNRQTSIARDITRNQVWLFSTEDDIFFGTGTITENTLNRIFVLPAYNKQNYQHQIMDFLEEKVSENYDNAILNALPTCIDIYHHRGYYCVENSLLHVDQGKAFFYQVMKKNLIRSFEKCPSYNGRIFITINSTDNSEADINTVFKYYQKDDLVWGDFYGEHIVKGYFLGKVLEDGVLDLEYNHINICGEIHRGKCKSIPKILPDGNLQLHESWQRLDAENVFGESMVIEVV